MSRNVALTLIGAGFVAAGLFLIGSDQANWPVGLFAVLFFGGCALVGLVDTVQGVWPPRPQWRADALVLRYNRVRIGVFFCASACWTLAGIVGLHAPTFPSPLGWALILFAGFSAAVFLSVVVDGGAQVVVDREGIADFRLLKRKVTWRDVAIGTRRSADDIVLEGLPRDVERLRTWRSRLSGQDLRQIRISSVLLDGTADDIEAAIKKFAPESLNVLPFDVDWDDAP